MTKPDIFREAPRCSECDCEHGGVYCNWIAAAPEAYLLELHALRDELDRVTARAEAAEGERDEARRRRDEWRKKAEGYDAVRRALREKVGAPWPPSLSRVIWAGIAADEKKRADDLAVALVDAADALREMTWWLADCDDKFAWGAAKADKARAALRTDKEGE